MNKLVALSLSATVLIILSACGNNSESQQSVQSASAQSTAQSIMQPEEVEQNPVKDYMDSNFDGKCDVITTDTRTDVRVYGLSKEDAESLVADIDGLAENISVSDYSADGSTIQYTYQNGKLTYDAENVKDYSIQGGGTVSMELYKKIKNGMTYNEVVNLIGADGKPVVSAGDGEYKTECYEWPGDSGDYSSVDVTFQGGVVAGKLQIGLE